jgi:hypothetical protein
MPKFRRPALPVEEEAVSKGEIIKGARQIHLVIVPDQNVRPL